MCLGLVAVAEHPFDTGKGRARMVRKREGSCVRHAGRRGVAGLAQLRRLPLPAVWCTAAFDGDGVAYVCVKVGGDIVVLVEHNGSICIRESFLQDLVNVLVDVDNDIARHGIPNELPLASMRSRPGRELAVAAEPLAVKTSMLLTRQISLPWAQCASVERNPSPRAGNS